MLRFHGNCLPKLMQRNVDGKSKSTVAKIGLEGDYVNLSTKRSKINCVVSERKKFADDTDGAVCDNGDIPKLAIPEGQKLRVERDVKLLEAKRAAIIQRRETGLKVRAELRDRTLQRMADYEAERNDVIQKKREAKAEGGFYKEAEPKVVFVIRIKGVNKIAPKPKKVFHLFRLLQIHNGVFIKVNKATEPMLKHIEPFVAYGYPSLSIIRKLIYKRGFVRVGKPGSRQRVRIQHNQIISEKLGRFGIHGVEDMVHEIYTCGEHFKQVTNFLWAFKLKSPSGGFVCKRHGYAEFRKGDWGNRETQINKLIERML